MEVILWIIIIGLFFISFLSIIYPLIPGSLLLWIGFLLYHFVLDKNTLTTTFWVVVAILTAILIISDIITNSYFVKKFGGSKWGERAAGIAIIVGSFIMPPFGILVIPILTVLLVEIAQKRTMEEAIWASIGSFVGFLSGTLAKVFIQLLMIICFFVSLL